MNYTIWELLKFQARCLLLWARIVKLSFLLLLIRLFYVDKAWNYILCMCLCIMMTMSW